MSGHAKIAAALQAVNGTLNIGAQITISGTEVKCHVFDGEDGTDKRYLDREACLELSAAFRVLGNAMRKP